MSCRRATADTKPQMSAAIFSNRILSVTLAKQQKTTLQIPSVFKNKLFVVCCLWLVVCCLLFVCCLLLLLLLLHYGVS